MNTIETYAPEIALILGRYPDRVVLNDDGSVDYELTIKGIEKHSKHMTEVYDARRLKVLEAISRGGFAPEYHVIEQVDDDCWTFEIDGCEIPNDTFYETREAAEFAAIMAESEFDSDIASEHAQKIRSLKNQIKELNQKKSSLIDEIKGYQDASETNKAMAEVIEIMSGALAAVREKKKQIRASLISEPDLNAYDFLVSEFESISDHWGFIFNAGADSKEAAA
jgi:hypothetical protein